MALVNNLRPRALTSPRALISTNLLHVRTCGVTVPQTPTVSANVGEATEMSYETYVRGLRMIEARGYRPLHPCKTRSDYELAREVLSSLHSSVIGAGSNTWRRHEERYRRARHIFSQLPTPCGATLNHVAEKCDGVGYGGICEKCSETVVSVMHRTCERYGIALD